MISVRRLTGKRALAYVAICLVALTALAGCNASNARSSGSASKDAHSLGALATASATAATNWLKSNGYAPLPIPGFGHVSFGLKSSAPKYAAVYGTTGKDITLVNTIVTDARQKLASTGTTGVTITVVGDQIVVTANREKDAKAAAHALLHAAASPNGNGGGA